MICGSSIQSNTIQISFSICSFGGHLGEYFDSNFLRWKFLILCQKLSPEFLKFHLLLLEFTKSVHVKLRKHRKFRILKPLQKVKFSKLILGDKILIFSRSENKKIQKTLKKNRPRLGNINGHPFWVGALVKESPTLGWFKILCLLPWSSSWTLTGWSTVDWKAVLQYCWRWLFPEGSGNVLFSG